MKCPCCGYVNGTSFNPSKRILELKRPRSKHTKKLIRRAVNLIQTNIASDNELIKEYYFWQTISKVPDKVVDWSINRYLESKQPLFDGKGFKYLAQIILNHNKNRTTISKNELSRRGKPPSVVTIKED
jgi:hypothetical protein